MAPALKKTCRLCYSEIDIRAKKCPFCHRLQGAYLWIGPALVLLGVIGMASLIILAGAETRRREIRTNRWSDIRVLSSDQYFAPSANQGKSAVIIGMIRNEGSIPLESIELEAQFFDNSGKLIDVFSQSIYGPLKSSEDKAFKISGDNIHLPASDYCSHKLIVKGAYEANH